MTNQTIFRRILTLSLLLLLCAFLPTVLANAMIELEVIKVDESNDPLAEAEFILEPGILGPNSVFVVESGASYLPVYAQSDSNGIVRFSFISPGVYRIREVTPPVGYIASGNELVLICDLDAIYAIASAPNVVGAVDRYRYDTPAIFVNTREAGSSINEPTNPLPLEQDITVRKTDEYGNPLAGAVFELIPGYFGQFGEFVEYYGDTGKSYQATSGANGNAIFQQVAPGVYRGYEVSPPFGYLPGTTEYYFVVNDGRVYLYASPSDLRAERELEQPAVFVNRSLPDLTIRKVDEDGNPLAGAIFVLTPGYYGQQQQFVSYPDQDPLHSTSTQNGYATFYQLSDGTYVLWESEPPQGYDQIPDEYYIIIDNGQIWIVGPVSGSISQNDRFPYDGPLVIVNQREEAELEEEVEEELEEKEEVEEEQIDELVPDPDPDPLPDPEPQYPQLNKEDHFAFLTGYPDKTFGPSRQMTRAEVAVMFARLLVEKMAVGQSYPNSFNDIPANAWYYNEIGYMEQFKVIGG
ncbi:MAG: SpaA isopeptide-forming pilin-related protein, partial [Symbiobacteriaceae bacterium]|nr:SpaA isopeptide-forming pilin-related protein [Symbiobacteriaceae bacterium]